MDIDPACPDKHRVDGLVVRGTCGFRWVRTTGSGHHGPVRDTTRLDLPLLLDGNTGVNRSALAAAGGAVSGGESRGLEQSAADGDPDARLQRGPRRRFCGGGCHGRVAEGLRRCQPVRCVRAERHDESGHLARGGANLGPAGFGTPFGLAGILPAPAAEPAAQGRQHCRLLLPVGRALPLHDRDGRRQ